MTNPRLTNMARKQLSTLVVDHFVRNDHYHVHRPSGDTAWFIVLTLKGRGMFRLGDAVFPCEQGDIVVIPPGIPQDYATAELSTWDFMWCHFLPPVNWNDILRRIDAAGNKQLFHVHLEGADWEEACSAFVRLYKNRETNMYLSLNGLEEVLIRISGLGNENGRKLDLRVSLIISYLADHLAESHSLEELAHRVHLSRSRVCHLFKEQTGESIVEALTRMRLHQAARLLEFTPMNISEIASDVGFRSPFYFTSRFTEYYGISPSEFKKRNKST